MLPGRKRSRGSRRKRERRKRRRKRSKKRYCSVMITKLFLARFTVQKCGYGPTDGPTETLTDKQMDGHTLLSRCVDASKKIFVLEIRRAVKKFSIRRYVHL